MLEEKTEKDKTLSILLLRGPYVSEYAEIASKLALTARKKGYKVNMFLYLDGVWLQHIKGFKDFSNPGDWLKRAVRKGVTVRACERCSSARDLTPDDTIKGIEQSGLYSFVDMLAESDRVLTFIG
ncbi:MAG: DsrE family protein [Thermoplasmata archaeon]|nr:DsrE family protein [Thermoplasmata archaeon]